MARGKKNQPVLAAPGIDPGAEAAPPPSGSGQQPNANEKQHLLYKGASGQMAVMSEFLYRLLNVAVPEVDVGDDVFVVKEKDDAVTRVQVKYAKADEQQNRSYVAQFNLPWDQFDRPDDMPALVYVLAVRFKDHWTDFLVIRRSVLRQLQADRGIGSVMKNKEGEPEGLKLRLVFTGEDVTGREGHSLQAYRNAFEPWPPPQLRHGGAATR